MSLGLIAKDSIQDFSLLTAGNGSTKPSPAEEIVRNGEVLQPTVANPQQAQEEDENESQLKQNDELRQAKNIKGQYAGFQSEYYYPDMSFHVAGDGYFHDPYAPTAPKNSGFFPNMVKCLFPWVFNDERADENKEKNDALALDTRGSDSSMSRREDGTRNANSEEDERSSNSDALGEKLTRKERQAVLARLGLAEPDKTSDEKKGLYNDSQVTSSLERLDDPCSNNDKTLQSPKGILKRVSTMDLNATNSSKSSESSSQNQASRRRSLFPQYESSSKGGKKLRVSFAPMARVATLTSKNDMEPEEKTAIWWQKSDYEDFRRTGRIITRAMMEGGSEIWLSNQNSVCNSPDNCDTDDTSDQEGNKWWHRFGHSRRGLEHVVSIQEGRERQSNVRSAIRAVVEEHNRQKSLRREDPEKLRVVALNLTSWARDLALAAGASDADAVKSSFAQDRKSREFYLLKMSRKKQQQQHSSRSMPGFMRPFDQTAAQKSLSGPKQQQRLDAHTSAQIRFRQKQATSSKSSSSSGSGNDEKDTSEPIKDPLPQRGESLAHRAAGFVDGEKVDLSGVLSGLGALPNNTVAT